jgi:hypothetical protein
VCRGELALLMASRCARICSIGAVKSRSSMHDQDRNRDLGELLRGRSIGLPGLTRLLALMQECPGERTAILILIYASPKRTARRQ